MYHRWACGIEDNLDKTLVITGGTNEKVTKYNEAGVYDDLPTLNTQRSDHGCGLYKNSNNQKVKIIVIVMNYGNVVILGISSGWRMVWLWIYVIIYRGFGGRCSCMEHRLTSAKKFTCTENREYKQLHSQFR